MELNEHISLLEFSWPFVELVIAFGMTLIFILSIFKNQEFLKSILTSVVVYLLIGGFINGISYLSMHRINEEIIDGRVKFVGGKVDYYRRPNELASFKVNSTLFMVHKSDAYCYSDIDLELLDKEVEIYYVELIPFVGTQKSRCILSLKVL